MAKLTLEASVAALDQVTAFVDEQLEQLDCPPKPMMQIEVAVEELFVNIASYAYAPAAGMATIETEIEEDPRAIRITFTDSGVPYDPLSRSDPDLSLPAEERQIGGLGIYMVRKSMDQVIYRHENGCNILTIRKCF